MNHNRKSSIAKLVKGCSAELLSSMLNAITESAFLMSLDGTIIAANIAMASRLGFENVEELVSRNAYTILPEDVMEKRREKVLLVAKTGKPVQFEDIRYGRTISNSIYPVFDNQGQVESLAVFGKDITEHKLQEKELSLMAEMVDSAPDSITVHDMDGNFLYANRETFDMHGCTKDEFMSINLHDLDVPESEALLEERFRLISQEGEAFFESSHFRKDGTVFPLRIRAKVVEWDGRPAVLSIASDITEQKRSERDLRISEERFRLLSDVTMEGIVIHKNGVAVEVNAAFCRCLGYSREELLGRNLLDVITCEEDRNIAKNNLEKETVDPYVIQVARKNGDVFFAELEARNIEKDGEKLRVTAVRDITKRKQAEDRLKRTRNRLQAIIDHSPTLISEFDTQGRYMLVNRQIATIFGMPVSDIEGKTFDELLDNKTVQRFMERIERILETQEPLAVEDSLTIDGERRDYLTTLFPLMDKDGAIYSIGSIALDITEQKQARDSLNEALIKLRRVTGSVIQVIVSAVESRDPYTAGHQKRVGDLARAIATEMGLSTDKVEGIRVAGVIHDLGKIGVPAEILSKPHRLGETEFAIIREHAKKGYEMLKDVHFDWPIAEMVYQHHERFDGSGYPRGLRGEDILVEARILAVADVVEAMSSHRPYRPTLGLDKALEEIESGRGILYDPDAVEACLRLFREKDYSFIVV